MGTDVNWNKPPLGGRIGEDEWNAVYAWGDFGDGAPDDRTTPGMESMIRLHFRLAESCGDYFRASIHDWPFIVGEMMHRGMIGHDVIPAGRVERNGNGEPVTPEQIVKALKINDYPILPTHHEDTEGFHRLISGLWVRWLCFMERAAALGDGFTVS